MNLQNDSPKSGKSQDYAGVDSCQPFAPSDTFPPPAAGSGRKSNLARDLASLRAPSRSRAESMEALGAGALNHVLMGTFLL